MLFHDIGQHSKPHVHVYYGEYEAAVAIDGELLAGSLPRKQLKIVAGWLAYHEEEAYKAWNLAVNIMSPWNWTSSSEKKVNMVE